MAQGPFLALCGGVSIPIHPLKRFSGDSKRPPFSRPLLRGPSNPDWRGPLSWAPNSHGAARVGRHLQNAGGKPVRPIWGLRGPRTPDSRGGEALLLGGLGHLAPQDESLPSPGPSPRQPPVPAAAVSLRASPSLVPCSPPSLSQPLLWLRAAWGDATAGPVSWCLVGAIISPPLPRPPPAGDLPSPSPSHRGGRGLGMDTL